MSSEPSNNRKRAAGEMDNKEEAESQSKAPRRPNDNDQPVLDADAELKWRGDPAETYSDWKIEIVTTKTTRGDDTTVEGEMKRTQVVQTYHVHRTELACGARKSDYFVRLFKAGFREAESRTSRIELEELAADAFPQFLDYIYCISDNALQISVETATALHCLGEYFEVEHLRWDAKHFIKEKLSLDSVAIFHRHAKVFQNSSILDMVAEFLAKNIVKISRSYDDDEEPPIIAAIAEEPDQELWLDVLNRIDSQDKEVSQSASDIVGLYCWRKRKLLSTATHLNLTDAKVLPHVDYRCAILLSRGEDEIRKNDPDQSGRDEGKGVEDLSSLQERCTTALASKFEDVLCWTETDDSTLQELKDRKPAFLVDLLIKSWKVADDNAKALQTKLDSAQTMLQKFKPIPVQNASSAPVPAELKQANPSLTETNTWGIRHLNHPTGSLKPTFFYDTNA